MKKPQRPGPAASQPIGVLAERAAEALRRERFKEATELYKLAIRQESRPEWKQSLAEAYLGRARTMAAKGMFKEAAMVLENTIAPDGTVRDSRLYFSCLIQDGQQPKAAAYLLRCLDSEGERTGLEDLAAALLVGIPQLPEAPRAGPSRWRDLAAASREALAAWINGASAEEMESQINRISLRSAFRPVRLLLKSLISQQSLISQPPDDGRARAVLAAIQPDSAFHPFRQAVEAVVLRERDLDAAGWGRLSPAQQAFVAETRGLPPASSQFLARLSEATQAGPGVLFSFLTRQPELPQAEVRSACLNLLPQIPDRVPQFEKLFGPLSALERDRVKALAAEARSDWRQAERSWQAVATAIAHNTDRQDLLSQGVIYRHLAHLALVHPELEGGDLFGNPVIYYLKRAYAADPEHLPSVLELIGWYRKDGKTKDWHRLVDEAVEHFPDDSQVLLQATESAVARKAYKKAAGFARRLLQINSINPGVRRQMIELQVAHARKQMRAKRPDLAAKDLSAAAEWERADAPSALLCIARGLIGLQIGDRGQAEAWLRQGVATAGGGAAGWFQARFEAELMKTTSDDAAWLCQELVRACDTPPTKDAVMTIISTLGQPEARENKRLVAGLLPVTHAWLQQAAAFKWTDAEFQSVAETFTRFDAFDLLREYTWAARQRDPANPIWRFHHIIARTRGNADRLSGAELNDLFEMAEAAAEREDFHIAKRIDRFLQGDDRPRSSKGRGAPRMPVELDPGEIAAAFAELVGQMPKSASRTVREIVGELGRDAALDYLMEEMRNAAMATDELPEPVLRTLCQAMVAKAMEGGRPQRSGKAGRSQFFDA